MRRTTRRIAMAALAAVSLLLTGCIGDGIHPVGGDGVATGLYHSAGARPGEVCVFERLGANQASFGGGFAGAADGPQFLEVMFTDLALVTTGCELWVDPAGLDPLLPPGTDIPPGTYRVGVDLAPGIYSVAGNATCRWTRLRNARHDGTSDIDAGFVRGLVGLVTIAPGDAFFETRGCEPWRRVA